MSVEMLKSSPAEAIADSLVLQILNRLEQGKLFEPDPYAHFTLKAIAGVCAENPDKLVLSSKIVDEFRIMASFLGAGFHPSQYEDVMYKKNDPDEVGRLYVGWWGIRRRVHESHATQNRMRDEVLHNELFTQLVPTTKYDLSTSHYITTEQDLKKIFMFDYDNLQACKDLDFDLLYERQD